MKTALLSAANRLLTISTFNEVKGSERLDMVVELRAQYKRKKF